MTLDVSSVRTVLDGSARWCSLVGDVRERLRDVPDGCAQTCVTSPPYYWQRDYGHPDQLGHEPTPAAYVASLVDVMREVRRTLRNDGTLWLNLGDTYYSAKGRSGGGSDPRQRRRGFSREVLRAVDGPGLGLPRKSLIGIPWRVALALQTDGWTLRSDVIWHRADAQPEPSLDRPSTTHEHLFLFAKAARYQLDRAALPHGTVWSIPARPRGEPSHDAPFPQELVTPCVLASTKEGDVVLDPFGGRGTTAAAALRRRWRAILCELNPESVALQQRYLAAFDAHAVSAVTVNAPSWGPLFGGAR